MGWSWRIGKIAGIDVYIHFTFLILLAWVGVAHYLPTGSLTAALAGLGFILALFGIVVLHELGHALAARRYDIQTRDITLLPIGGVARLERMPDNPKEELVVALAGPAVNVVLAAGLFVGIVLNRGLNLASLDEIASWDGRVADRLLAINLWLAAFNMIPAFPMDGGRVLRAVLALRIDYVRATRVAAGIGQGMAVLFGLVGLFGNPLLLFIAWFVWMGAAAEAAAVEVRAGLAGLPVSAALIRDFVALAPDDTLRTASGHVLNGFQQDFPVLTDGRVVGVLPRAGLLTGLADRGPDAAVADVMRQDFQTADPNEMLQGALGRLNDGCCPVLPVVEGDRLVGLLTPENVGELIMIREALRGGRGTRPREPQYIGQG